MNNCKLLEFKRMQELFPELVNVDERLFTSAFDQAFDLDFEPMLGDCATDICEVKNNEIDVINAGEYGLNVKQGERVEKNTTSFIVDSGLMTLSFWVLFPNEPDVQTQFLKTRVDFFIPPPDPTVDDLEISEIPDGNKRKIGFNLKHGTSSDFNEVDFKTKDTLKTNVWYQIVIEFDVDNHTNSKVYFNGVETELEFSIAEKVILKDNNLITIGNTEIALADLIIQNDKLSVNEIELRPLSLGFATELDNLLFRIPFNELSGDKAKDLVSGTDFDLTGFDSNELLIDGSAWIGDEPKINIDTSPDIKVLSQSQKDLLEYGEKYFAWAVLNRYYSLNPNLKISKSGIVQDILDSQLEQEYELANSKDIERKIFTIRDTRDHYKQKFLEFLQKNVTSFPCLPEDIFDSCLQSNHSGLNQNQNRFFIVSTGNKNKRK